MTMYHITDKTPVACGGIFACDAPRHYPSENAALVALGVAVPVVAVAAETPAVQQATASGPNVGDVLGGIAGGIIEVVGNVGGLALGVVEIVSDIASGFDS